MIRKSTTARCSSAHSVRLKLFIGRPAASCRLGEVGFSERRTGQRDLQSGRHLLHPCGDDLPAGRHAGDQREIVAIAVHRHGIRSTLPTGSLPACLTTQTAGWPLAWVSAVAGIAATCTSDDHPVGHQRGGRAERQRPGAHRLQPGAVGARLRRGLRRQLAQRHLELLVRRARERGLEVRLLERGSAGLPARRRRSPGVPGSAMATTGWPSATTWPDLEAHRSDDAAARGAQHRVLQAVARELELARLRLFGRLRRLRAAVGVLVVGDADRAVGLQRRPGACGPIRPGGPARRRPSIAGARPPRRAGSRSRPARRGRRPRARTGRRRPCAAPPCRRRGRPGRPRSATARCRHSDWLRGLAS